MLRPLIFTDEELKSVTITTTTSKSSSKLPSKTYKMDFNTGEIYAEFIDYGEAVKQAVVKAIKTIRDQYIIYSSDYGCEITKLLGKNHSIEYLQLEVPRLVDEALSVDDRIDGTEKYTISKTGDELNISFTVITNVGASVKVEVAI